MSTSIGLRLGALAPSIADQLADQGLWSPSAELHERVRRALRLLLIEDYISETVVNRACKRLVNAVAKDAQPLTEARV